MGERTLRHQKGLLKVKVSQLNGVADLSVNGSESGWQEESCLCLPMVHMERFIPFSMIQLSMQNSDHVQGQTSGLWIPQSCPSL